MYYKFENYSYKFINILSILKKVEYESSWTKSIFNHAFLNELADWQMSSESLAIVNLYFVRNRRNGTHWKKTAQSNKKL